MLYKPNYCCNCGEKVERIDWNLLTSRRFCDTCAIENRRHDYLPRALVGSGALALMFGFGSLWGGADGSVHSPQPPLPVALKNDERPQQRSQISPNNDLADTPVARDEGTTAPLPAPAEFTNIERKPAEIRFYCGALTRKGTPCSRKVKAKGDRCFQHEGRPEAPPIN